MENEDTITVVRPWIDSEERITVGFGGEKELNALVTECTATIVTLVLEISFPHLRQEITLPFRVVGCRYGWSTAGVRVIPRRFKRNAG